MASEPLSTPSLNRRALLGGLALTTAAVAIPAAAAITAPRPGRSAWDRAMRTHLQAVAASDAFDPEYDRIDKAHQAEVNAVPHVTKPGGGYGHTLSTANTHDVARARRGSSSLRYVETCAYDDVKAEQEFVDAADARDEVIEGIHRKYNWDAVNKRYDALQSAMLDTENVLLQTPAPDGEAVLWKVERLYKPGDGIWSEGIEDQTYADLHRFLSTGRA